MRKFKLPYFVRDCGDGSVSVSLCHSIEEAEKAFEQEEKEGYNFAEFSGGEFDIVLKDNKLYFQHGVFNDGVYSTQLTEIKEYE